MKTLGLDLFSPTTGLSLGALPDVQSIAYSPIFCDAGTLTFNYTENGKHFWTMRDAMDADSDFIVELRVDGKLTGIRAIVNEYSGGDITNDKGAAIWQFTARLYEARLDEAVVPAGATDPFDYMVPDWTAGQILGALLLAAQGRGGLTDMTWDFTNTVDSNGVAWDKVISIAITPGTSLLDVAKALNTLQMAEFRVVGNEIQLFKYETLTVDRTLTTPPLVFRAGRDLKDSPRKKSLRGAGTTVMFAGKDGLYLEQTDATAVAARGRRIEVFESQGSISDPGTAAVYMGLQLDKVKQGKLEKTHGLAFTAGSMQPIANFDVGDWAYSDTGRGLERYRIQQWSASWDATGISGTVTLNDVFADWTERLSHRINGITGGTTILGTSKATVPPDVTNGVPPAAPASATLTSAAYVDGDGATQAQLTCSWTAVVANADATPIEDLANYVVQWKYTAESVWRSAGTTTDTILYWSPVVSGQGVKARVAARDKSGNVSAWTETAAIFSASDAVAPPKPSTPITDNYLGLAKAEWDGKGSLGEDMPADFSHVEVHWSIVNNFTPDATTLVDVLEASAASYFDGAYGVTVYCKLIAVDRTKNKSVASTQGSAVPTQVVTGDVGDGVISTAKIMDLAVNDAKIGNVSAGKITVGVLTADITVSSRIKTADTGARVELNATGLKAYNSSGTLTVDIDSDGDVSLIGKIVTGGAGQRIEFNPSTVTPQIRFYGSAVTRYAQIMAYDDGIGGSGINMRSARLLADADNGSGRSSSILLHQERLSLQYGSDAGMYAARVRLTMDVDTIAMECGPANTQINLSTTAMAVMINSSNQMQVDSGGVKAPLYSGPGGSQAQIHMVTANNLSFGWSGGQIIFYVDSTPVKAL